MDSQIRAQAQAARSTHYFDIMRTVCFVEVGLLAIVVFGDTTGATPALWALIAGTALYGVLAGDQALKDVKNLRDSMDEATANSPYGAGARAIPFDLFRAVSAIANVVIALALLISI